jgi:hypothetical protein
MYYKVIQVDFDGATMESQTILVLRDPMVVASNRTNLVQLDAPLDDCDYTQEINVSDISCEQLTIYREGDSLYFSVVTELHSGGLCFINDNSYKFAGADFHYDGYDTWVFHVDDAPVDFFITKKTKYWYDGPTDCDPLPIVIKSFTGRKIDNYSNMIILETASEINSESVALYASVNGETDWVFVERKSTHNKPSKYSFKHYSTWD